MKKGIHPEIMECQVTCTCGHSFVVFSDRPTLRIEVCDKCHPFYTGKERNLNVGGKVDKFKKKYGLA
ncbi:MAG: 50S ribosomal protein L31 [Nautiliaceae bacterium]|jgi:large subunit ribosomal protein L31